MKVLIINTSWTGDSTGKIAYGMYKSLVANGHESKLVYGYQDVICDDENVISIDTMFDIRLQWAHNQLTGLHGAYSPRAMKRLKRIIDDFRPDVVQLYNLHGYYIDVRSLFKYLKQKQIPIVYGMLDEHPYLGYCCYAFECDQFKTGCLACEKDRFKKEYPRSLFVNGAKKMARLKRQAYDNYERLVFTGPKWVLERAQQSWLLKGKKLFELDEYIDTDETFIPRKTDDLRRELGIGEDEIVLLDVGRSNDERKGVGYFIELARRFEGNPKYRFINIGYAGDKADLPGNFIPVSFMKDQKLLAKYYSMADLFVCTSMADTMPNTCLDSMACGTPVCGFTITGVPYVAEKPMGHFFAPANVDELFVFIKEMKPKSKELANQCREYAVKRYSKEVYYKKLVGLYESLVTKNE